MYGNSARGASSVFETELTLPSEGRRIVLQLAKTVGMWHGGRAGEKAKEKTWHIQGITFLA